MLFMNKYFRWLRTRPALSILILGTALVSAPLLHAQQSWAGNIQGTLLDPHGAPVAAAVLRLTSEANGSERQAESDERGYYGFPLVAAGTYDLAASKPGF